MADAGDNWAAFRAAYEKKLTEALERHPEEYAYGPGEVPGVVDKMLRALAAGTAHVGPATKAAARACGVRPTVRDIKAFLGGDR